MVVSVVPSTTLVAPTRRPPSRASMASHPVVRRPDGFHGTGVARSISRARRRRCFLCRARARVCRPVYASRSRSRDRWTRGRADRARDRSRWGWGARALGTMRGVDGDATRGETRARRRLTRKVYVRHAHRCTFPPRYATRRADSFDRDRGSRARMDDRWARWMDKRARDSRGAHARCDDVSRSVTTRVRWLNFMCGESCGIARGRARRLTMHARGPSARARCEWIGFRLCRRQGDVGARHQGSLGEHRRARRRHGLRSRLAMLPDRG